MAVIWTITGEAGKRVDGTGHTLEQLGASGATVTFRSLEADTFQWSVWIASLAEAAHALLPDLGQKITLWRNGTRYFTGIVTGRDPDLDARQLGWQITVSGPWWWLEQLSLSSMQADQAGEEAERTVYVLPTGSPRAHIIALLNRAIALGAPVSVGSIASVFAVPRLSLRNAPFGESIADVMRWVADGICYFDYSPAGTHPALCMQRRPAASIMTLTPASGMPRVKLRPRIDLKAEEVSVYYARRETVDARRSTVWESQSAGLPASGLPARQPVVISGPEKAWDVLPQDFTDSVVVRSAPAMVAGEIPAAMLWRYDERLRASGAIPSLTRVGLWSEPQHYLSYKFQLPGVATRITDSEGNAIPTSYTHYLTAGEPRDWWTKDGIENVNARVTATISTYRTTPLNETDPAAPKWFELIGGNYESYAIPQQPPPAIRKHVWSATVSVVVPMVKTPWTADTLLIRSEDYAFVQPPEGLAANLLATQNWLPYDGDVSYETGEIPDGHHLGRRLNISGFLPETANMGALIHSQSVSLATGSISLGVGAPPRMGYRDLVNRFRQRGADNIVWLVDQVSGNPGENPPPDPELEIPVAPENAILFNGQPLTWNGEYLVWTPSPYLRYEGSRLLYEGRPLTFNPD